MEASNPGVLVDKHWVAVFSAEGLPRTRGDGPYSMAPGDSIAMVAPYTRGWSPAVPDRDLPQRGCPVHAGMVLSIAANTSMCERLPRTRGDGPWTPVYASHNVAVAPYTRGWSSLTASAVGRTRGCPVHAGMVP